jgi:hypothetical protein
MNISKITIGRLYNLGNYEHIRYELTAEIPAGESPATAMIGMEKILRAINPKRPSGVLSEDELQHARGSIERLKALTDEECADRYGVSKAVKIHEATKELTEYEKHSAAWNEHQARARKLLEDLGGAANLKDAKQDWEDDREF